MFFMLSPLGSVDTEVNQMKSPFSCETVYFWLVAKSIKYIRTLEYLEVVFRTHPVKVNVFNLVDKDSEFINFIV